MKIITINYIEIYIILKRLLYRTMEKYDSTMKKLSFYPDYFDEDGLQETLIWGHSNNPTGLPIPIYVDIDGNLDTNDYFLGDEAIKIFDVPRWSSSHFKHFPWGRDYKSDNFILGRVANDFMIILESHINFFNNRDIEILPEFTDFFSNESTKDIQLKLSPAPFCNELVTLINEINEAMQLKPPIKTIKTGGYFFDDTGDVFDVLTFQIYLFVNGFLLSKLDMNKLTEKTRTLLKHFIKVVRSEIH